jgi:nicotinamidase-related amidase
LSPRRIPFCSVIKRRKRECLNDKTVLLVIDQQVGPLWGTYKKEGTFSVVLNMIERAEKENIPIIYIQHEELPGGLMVSGSQFWEFSEGINPRPEDLIIHKQVTDAFYQTGLKEELDKQGTL